MEEIIKSSACSDMGNMTLFQEALKILKNWQPNTSGEINAILSLGNILIELKYRAAMEGIYLSLDDLKSSEW